MALSLGFLLTVSWHARPFYYGADIVFLFAWTPLLIGGAGPMSLDALTRAGVRDRLGLPSDPAVVIGFDSVRQLCGAYVDGHCKARRDHRCSPDGCPVLAASAPPAAVVGEVDRRAFMQKAGIAGWLGAAAVVGGGIVALIGRVAPVKASKSTPALSAGPTDLSTPPTSASPDTTGAASSPSSTPAASGPPASSAPATAPPATAAAPTTQPPPPPPGLTALGPASSVAVGGAASFTDPSSGDAAFVVQPTAGRFVAFDAACTHQGCPVQYAGSHFECPCHGAQFDSATGEVLQGPANSPLRKIGITVSGGTLYAQ
jgi:thiosulfate dehydrogenase [quinone] large subunit